MKKKDTILLFITALLLVVFFMVVRYQIRQRGIKQPAFLRPKMEQSSPMPAPLEEERSLYDQLKAQADKLKFTRDPFYKEFVAPPPKEPQLMGIAWEEANPTALIDDTIVKVGDKIGDKTVVSISKDSVILNDGVKDVTLTLVE